MTESPWLGFIDRGAELTEEDKSWSELANALEVSLSEYDSELISLLQKGYFDKVKFREAVVTLNNEIETRQARDNLKKAWLTYTGTFSENTASIKNAFFAVFESNIEKLGIWDFSAAIDLLEKLKIDASKYVNLYIKKHEARLHEIETEGYFPNQNIANPKLLSAINKAKNSEKINLNIDEITTKISTSDNWNQDDIEYLYKTSVDNIYEWMLSEPSNITQKIQRGLLYLSKIRYPEEEKNKKLDQIKLNTIEALKRIATINDVNKLRISSIYGIELQEEGE